MAFSINLSVLMCIQLKASNNNNSIQIPTKGNKFVKEIEFREGASIQLLRYSENSENGKFGQILLNPEALNILRKINEPLAIISVGKQHISIQLNLIKLYD